MILGISQLAAPGTGASSFEAISYVGLLVVGSLSLLLMLALNVVAVWWLLHQSPWFKPRAVQYNEDGAGWADHAQRVVASEREVARLRAENPDCPTL